MSHKLYNNIAEEICRRICIGEYAVGSKLPGHRALASEFHVSSRTVYKALAELKVRGVFRPTPRGSFVTGHGLQENSKGVIAIITPDKDNLPIEDDPLKMEIINAAISDNFEVVLQKVNSGNFSAYTNFYNAPYCAGIFFIYSTGFMLTPDTRFNVPFVSLNYIPGFDEQYCASMDWRQMIFRRIKNMLNKACCRPVIACSSEKTEQLGREYWDCWQDVCEYYHIKNYSPEPEFFQRSMIDNLPYWFADKNNAPDSILFMEHPTDENMQKTMELLRQYNVPVRMFCDIKWAEYVPEGGEFFGLQNEICFRKLGRQAWEKLLMQREFAEKNNIKEEA